MAASFLTSSINNNNNTNSNTSTTNPLVDRYLSNPLTFKQAKIMDNSSSTNDLISKSSNYIILSRKHSKRRSPSSSNSSSSIINGNISPSNIISSPSRIKPKSMAEAVAAYTGKKFLTKNEKKKQQLQSKKRKLDLVDSDDEQEQEEQQQEEVVNQVQVQQDQDEVTSTISTASSYLKNIFSSLSGNSTTNNKNVKRQKIQLTPIETDDEDEDEDDDDEEDLGEYIPEDGESTPTNVTDDASPFNGFSEPESKGATPTPQDDDDEEEDEDEDDDDEDEDDDDEDFEIDQDEEQITNLNQSSSASSSSPDPEEDDNEDLGEEVVDEDEDVEQLKHDLKEDAYKALEEESIKTKLEDEEEEEEEEDDDSDKPNTEKSTPPTSPEDELEKVITTQASTPKQSLIPKNLELQTIKEHFYMINENSNDKGSNDSTRIYKNWKNLTKKKPIGLINHGVTCYMNSAIQAMIHIPAIQHYLTDVNTGKYNKILKPRSVTHVLADLSRKMWNLDGGNQKLSKFINPKKLIGRLDEINCMMSQWQQEDSHEYFMSLMSRLQEDSTPKGKKLNESIIYDIFGGLLRQKITCNSCNNVSITKQEFYDLSLGLNKRKQQQLLPSNNSSINEPYIPSSNKYSIGKSIRDFFSNELIKVDKNDLKNSGYYCENCKKRTMANKISFIERSPETLTIHLKRFKFNGNSSSKVKQSINYSKFLDLSKYCLNEDVDDDEEEEEQPQAMYQLLSVLVHEGRSISSGHYIAHCLQPDGSWGSYDDEYINKIDERMALNDPSAYVLIYTKLTPKKN
ncbi:Dot4 protein [Scheffersomyces coipomensis]|uniref:Dot4 protein n=1 Tax=Scheffersomyces coipomensis TaxID=1788519 RepID=UPI00315D3DA3